MKERIFISYKRDDKDIVFKIKDDIEKNVGEKCWIDLDGIESDAQFVNVIIKSIDEAEIFLFMYSKKHAEITDFENDWTIREINYAQSQGKRIIFLNIDKTPLSKWFTMMFGLKQQVDVTSVSAMNKLYGDLNKWLSDGDNDKKGGSENDNSEICYKVRVNRACWLYLDDEKMQPLEANKIVKFYLESGVYLRKVVDCEDENVSKEDKITLSEKQVFEDIDLALLYQKYVKGNTKRNFVIEFFGKCRKYLQIFKWIAFACFVCAFIYSVVLVAFIGERKGDKVISKQASEVLIVDGHECVDLGLSVKWATCNVGATTPEECGYYFAWGETISKENYDPTTCKYVLKENQLTKYCNNSNYGKDGFIDSKTILDPEDDAATVNWGGNWRMPTEAEMTELKEQCTWTWAMQNGVNGCKVVGPNGNFIFLPAAGYMDSSSFRSAGSYGLYWSSSHNTSNPYYANFVYFDSNDVIMYGFCRYYGLSVRPVCQ